MITFITILLTVSSVFAQNEEAEIRSLLESRDQEIKQILGSENTNFSDDQRDRLKDIINGIIDYREMGTYALGDTFNEISEDQKEEFLELFATIIRDQSLNRLDIYRAEVTYNEIEVNGSDARVNTMARVDDVRTPVHYKMEKRDNEWVITDMSIDDVSTAESYRRQFQSIIRQRGFDALLQSLQRRAARSST